jgi:hypothetical protein
VEQLGASRRREGLEAFAEGLLHLVEGHALDATSLYLGEGRTCGEGT